MKSVVFCILSSIYQTSCHDKSGTVKTHLKGAPGDFKEVNVDIQEVMVKMEKSSEWVTLNTHQRIYNLLSLQKIDTLLAVGIVPTGSVTEVRLILGPDNSLMLNDSSIYPLATPSAEHSGLKIKVHKTVLDDEIATLFVDFDAKLSIQKTGSGKYILDPVLQLK